MVSHNARISSISEWAIWFQNGSRWVQSEANKNFESGSHYHISIRQAVRMNPEILKQKIFVKMRIRYLSACCRLGQIDKTDLVMSKKACIGYWLPARSGGNLEEIMNKSVQEWGKSEMRFGSFWALICSEFDSDLGFYDKDCFHWWLNKSHSWIIIETTCFTIDCSRYGHFSWGSCCPPWHFRPNHFTLATSERHWAEMKPKSGPQISGNVLSSLPRYHLWSRLKVQTIWPDCHACIFCWGSFNRQNRVELKYCMECRFCRRFCRPEWTGKAKQVPQTDAIKCERVSTWSGVAQSRR
jgi:hypothetical protein